MENITTINWHLLKACNMQCKFCYATFHDIKEKRLNKENGFQLLKNLWETGKFRKINFAGGEPTLIPNLIEYITKAKQLGFETSIVTNGSKLTLDWVQNAKSFLDIIGLSVDSVCEQTNIRTGRALNGQPITFNEYLNIAKIINEAGISLKINTVVNKLNFEESMVDFINSAAPFRWKILQATEIEGQNNNKEDNLSLKDLFYRIL
jgi:radical S-adenosyl methionine domain-containing protein 2